MADQPSGFFGVQNNSGSADGAGLSTEELQKATAAVLIAAARSDGSIAPAELSAIVSAVEKHLHLSSAKARELVEWASASQSPLDSFVETIREKLSTADREQVLRCAWAVILRDSAIALDEGKFVVSLRQALGLSMEQSVLARKEAEGVSFDGFKELVDASKEMIDQTHEAASHGHLLDTNPKLKP
ncbi:MAG: TerB family tellurite resistance protein [Bdellovibrionota bacterium]